MGAALPRFIAFGEALTDFIRQDDGARWVARPGGSPWNVARVAARLGVPAAFAGAVSRDVLGAELVRASDQAGLDPRFLQQVDRPPLLAFVHQAHPPRYFFVGADSADLHFDPDRLPAGWLEAVVAVHFGSISLAREPLAGRLVRLAERCRAAGAHLTFDPNHRVAMGEGWPAVAERLVRLAQVVKLSDDDLAQLLPDLSEADALARLREWNPEAVLLYTRGARGIRMMAPEVVIDRPAVPAQVVDTVGAGDACLGGWIASWLARPAAPLARHLDFAAATAAAVCERAGAHAPSGAEVEAVLAR
jgi:fructokinase